MTETNFPLAAGSLPVRFVIYLPSAPENPEVNADFIEQAVARILCERFGGVTAYAAKGTFVSATGAVQTEPITVLEAYCEENAWEQNREGIASCARLLAKLLRQEALGCSVNGKMTLIEAEGGSLEIDDRKDTVAVYTLLQRALEKAKRRRNSEE